MTIQREQPPSSWWHVYQRMLSKRTPDAKRLPDFETWYANIQANRGTDTEKGRRFPNLPKGGPSIGKEAPRPGPGPEDFRMIPPPPPPIIPPSQYVGGDDPNTGPPPPEKQYGGPGSIDNPWVNSIPPENMQLLLGMLNKEAPRPGPVPEDLIPPRGF